VNPRIGWGQPPSSWGQPHFPGWAPLVDPDPLPLRAVSSVARWWWPTLAVGGFLAVVAYVADHDHPGLSHRGLLNIALAALVVVLLTIHRRRGPGPLARAVTEYTVVALLAALLAAPGVDQQPDRHAASTDVRAQAAAGDDQPAVIQARAKVVRAVTGAARAVAGAVRWLVDLWRQADQQTRSANSHASAAWPPSPFPVLSLLWRCL
jgi:hypothetical protein